MTKCLDDNMEELANAGRCDLYRDAAGILRIDDE